MNNLKGHDLGKYQRLIFVEGERVRGTFHVLLGFGPGSQRVWVKPFDVTVYADEAHTWGRMLYSQDLTASVEDGEVQLKEHTINSDLLDTVRDVWDEMLAAIAAAVTAALEQEAKP